MKGGGIYLKDSIFKNMFNDHLYNRRSQMFDLNTLMG